MRQHEVIEEMGRLMMNPKTTVKQLQALAKQSKWHLFWGMNKDCTMLETVFAIRDVNGYHEGWYAYIGPKVEPLPPKRKVTQTLYLVPAGWAGQGGGRVYFDHWLSPDDTIPPCAIETVYKHEVEQ